MSVKKRMTSSGDARYDVRLRAPYAQAVSDLDRAAAELVGELFEPAIASGQRAVIARSAGVARETTVRPRAR